MSQCCRDSSQALVDFDKKDKTCGISATKIKVFNQYQFNKNQNGPKNNTIDAAKLKTATNPDAVSYKMLHC